MEHKFIISTVGSAAINHSNARNNRPRLVFHGSNVDNYLLFHAFGVNVSKDGSKRLVLYATSYLISVW